MTRLANDAGPAERTSPKPLPLSTLSALLWGSYGIIRTDAVLLGGSLALMRPVPSAGGLFPLEIYVATQRVQDLPDGLHHYNVRNHALEPLSDGPVFKSLQPHLFMYPAIEHANAIVFLAAVFNRTQKKYGPRGYRYILLEAGHVAQNLCLLAVEQGLGTLCMGGYTDGELNQALGLNPSPGRRSLLDRCRLAHYRRTAKPRRFILRLSRRDNLTNPGHYEVYARSRPPSGSNAAVRSPRPARPHQSSNLCPR